MALYAKERASLEREYNARRQTARPASAEEVVAAAQIPEKGVLVALRYVQGLIHLEKAGKRRQPRNGVGVLLVLLLCVTLALVIWYSCAHPPGSHSTTQAKRAGSGAVVPQTEPLGKE